MQPSSSLAENVTVRSDARQILARFAQLGPRRRRVHEVHDRLIVGPREIALPFAGGAALRIVPLTDAWARRRFAICIRDEAHLSPAARLLVKHLSSVQVEE